MHIEILDDAQEDMLQGTLFYESQQYGTGDYFLESIGSDIESLHLYAGIHTVRNGYYVLFSKRFPYTIYYKIEDEIVKVYAILDDRSNPKTIVSRLEEKQ